MKSLSKVISDQKFSQLKQFCKKFIIVNIDRSINNKLLLLNNNNWEK